jgi:hypothetical protein
MNDGGPPIPFNEELFIPWAGSEFTRADDGVAEEGYAEAKTRFGDDVTDIKLISTLANGTRH